MKAIKPYEEEFKKRAVAMLRSSGKPAVQIARELGCTADSLRTWKCKYDNPLECCLNPDELTPAELKRENACLQKELNYVTEQRDILKKSLSSWGIEYQGTSSKNHLFKNEKSFYPHALRPLRGLPKCLFFLPQNSKISS